MTGDIDIHMKKKWERIEVLGLLDTRTIIEESIPEKSSEGHTRPKRYVNELVKPAKKVLYQ